MGGYFIKNYSLFQKLSIFFKVVFLLILFVKNNGIINIRWSKMYEN